MQDSLLKRYRGAAKETKVPMADDAHLGSAGKARFPLLAAYDLCLKCSHLFNILDARGAISVTERVGVIARVRALAVGIAKAWVDQQKSESAAPEKSDEPEPVRQRKNSRKRDCRRWFVSWRPKSAIARDLWGPV